MASNDLVVKAKFNDEFRVRRFPLASVNVDELVKSLQGAFGLSTPIVVKYEDEDGDMVTIMSESDLSEAMRQRSDQTRPLKVMVTPAPHLEQATATVADVTEDLLMAAPPALGMTPLTPSTATMPAMATDLSLEPSAPAFDDLLTDTAPTGASLPAPSAAPIQPAPAAFDPMSLMSSFMTGSFLRDDIGFVFDLLERLSADRDFAQALASAPVDAMVYQHMPMLLARFVAARPASVAALQSPDVAQNKLPALLRKMESTPLRALLASLARRESLTVLESAAPACGAVLREWLDAHGDLWVVEAADLACRPAVPLMPLALLPLLPSVLRVLGAAPAAPAAPAATAAAAPTSAWPSDMAAESATTATATATATTATTTAPDQEHSTVSYPSMMPAVTAPSAPTTTAVPPPTTTSSTTSSSSSSSSGGAGVRRGGEYGLPPSPPMPRGDGALGLAPLLSMAQEILGQLFPAPAPRAQPPQQQSVPQSPSQTPFAEQTDDTDRLYPPAPTAPQSLSFAPPPFRSQQPLQQPAATYDAQLATLSEMGFTNVPVNEGLLRQYQGDVSRVVQVLLEQ